MSRTATLLSTLAIALATMLSALPAHAQRVYVSGSGSDSHPCTFARPCRTFQQAFNTAPADGEIDVLDPAGYGPLTIDHGISIQGHGFAGIIQTSGSDAAITVNSAIANDISLNGLLIDGAGSGLSGIQVNSAGGVQILNCVIRHFTNAGINFTPNDGPSSLLVSDTVASDNGIAGQGTGININPVNAASTNAILNRITANNNQYGVAIALSASVMIANSVMSNNSKSGLSMESGGTAWLGTSAISNNGIGVWVNGGGTVNSYGNNQINGNTTDVSGSLTRVSTQ